MVGASERVLVEDRLSKLFPFLVSTFRDITLWLLFSGAGTVGLSTKVVSQLTDQVLDSFVHLFVAVAEC